MRSRGLTLVELIVSISLLALVVMFVLELVPTSMLSLRRSEGRLVGETIAEGELEREASAAFVHLTAGSQKQLPDQTVGSLTYHLKTQTLRAGSENPNRLLTLKVTVTWTEQGTTRTAVRERWASVAIDT